MGKKAVPGRSYIEIDARLHRVLKERSAHEGKTLKLYITELVICELKRRGVKIDV